MFYGFKYENSSGTVVNEKYLKLKDACREAVSSLQFEYNELMAKYPNSKVIFENDHISDVGETRVYIPGTDIFSKVTITKLSLSKALH